MSQRAFFITLLGTLIALAGIECVALAQPAPDEAGKATNPANWQPNRVPLNIRIEAPDGTPVAKHNIDVNFEGERTGVGWHDIITDEQGGFAVFQGFQPAVYTLYIHAPGIGSGYFKGVNVQKAGEPIIHLKLQPGGTLRAIACEAETNTPLGGAQLFLQLFPAVAATDNPGNQNVHPLMIFTHEPTRDGDGSIEVSNLLPGRYQLSATGVPGYVSISRDFVMTEGAEVPLNLYLTRDMITWLKVMVRNPQGQPLPNTDITLTFMAALPGVPGMQRQGATGLGVRRIHTNARGEAVLYPVKPGTWKVSADTNPTISSTEVKIAAEGGTVSLVAKPN